MQRLLPSYYETKVKKDDRSDIDVTLGQVGVILSWFSF